jgi:cyclopropane fatty-acyl-phospholipid synthase-like methyltransferase
VTHSAWAESAAGDPLSNRELARTLVASVRASGLPPSLRLVLRPYICPFGDLLRLVEPGDRVFDVGCGSGMFLVLTAQLRHPAQVEGIEISAERVADAARQLDRLRVDHRVAMYDGSAIPERIAEFNKVFLIDVLHHIPKDSQRPFLARLYQAMSPGSTLVVKDISAESPLVYVNKLHDLVVSREIGHERRSADVAEWVRQLGFRVDSVARRRTLLYPHYTVVCTRS